MIFMPNSMHWFGFRWKFRPQYLKFSFHVKSLESCFIQISKIVVSISISFFFKGGLATGDNFIRFSEINETYQALSPLNKVIPINGATANVYSISMEIKEQITNCSEDSMTPCIESFYEKKYGNSYDSLIGRSHNFTLAAFDGTETLESITGK